MPRFVYEAMDQTGLEVYDQIEAASEEDAMAAIRDRGYFLTKISVAKPRRSARNRVDFSDVDFNDPQAIERKLDEIQRRYTLRHMVFGWLERLWKRFSSCNRLSCVDWSGMKAIFRLRPRPSA